MALLSPVLPLFKLQLPLMTYLNNNIQWIIGFYLIEEFVLCLQQGITLLQNYASYGEVRVMGLKSHPL